MVSLLRAAGCVFAEEEAVLLADAASGAALDVLVARRVAGEPLEHVLGWVGFGGLRLAVAPGVFVPRRRTELMADVAAGLLRDVPDPVLVELCCGVAAVSAAVVAAVPGVRVHASDLDPAAVTCARANLPVDADVAVADLDAAIPVSWERRVGVLAANTPYVPSAEVSRMPREARDHEPLLALDGGADGLDVARRVVALAGRWLAPGGHVVVETSARQGAGLAASMADAGLGAEVRHDPEREATLVVGRAP